MMKNKTCKFWLPLRYWHWTANTAFVSRRWYGIR